MMPDSDELPEVNDDVVTAEASWALFCAALRSYKKDFLLKPFPPMFKDEEGQKDFQRLVRKLGTTPTGGIN